MSRPPNIVEEHDAPSLPDHELGALQMTLPVRKSARSSAWHEGAGSDLGAQGSIDPGEHHDGIPNIEEELRKPAGSPISDEGGARDLAARHSITARSNPPSPRDRRPVHRRDAEPSSTYSRSVRVLLRHYATVVDRGTATKMTPEQENKIGDADPNLSVVALEEDHMETS